MTARRGLLAGMLALLSVAGGARGDTAAETFAQWRSAIASGDHAALMDLAVWAIDANLLDEADDVFRSILHADPLHDPAYHALRHLSLGRALPRDSKPFLTTRAELPETFVVVETAHFVILSDADPGWTREQGDRLERAHARFERFAHALELRPHPLRHKLVAVAFGERDDFRRFAAADGIGTPPGLAGYYSPRHDRLVFFHVASDANVAAARRELARQADEIDAVRRARRRARMTRQRDEARDIERELAHRERHFATEAERLEAFARQHSLSVTVHEAIHHLMFHSRVQSPFVQHPAWLSEGLATAFETDNPRSAFGPFREFWPRRDGFEQMRDDGRLLPLRELVTAAATRLARDPAFVYAVYHQGYALVRWMSEHRRIELRNYLRGLNALPPGVPDAATQLRVFEDAFGPVDEVEQRWLAFETR